MNLERIVNTKVVKSNTDHLCKMNHRLQLVESTNVCGKCMPGFRSPILGSNKPEPPSSYSVGREKTKDSG